MENAYLNLIGLIPIIVSTLANVLVSKIAGKAIDKTSRSRDKQIELLKEENELLKEQNLALKNTLSNVDNRVSANLKNQEIIIKEVGMLVDTQRVANDNAQKIVDDGTVIRNELRTLLNDKKE